MDRGQTNSLVSEVVGFVAVGIFAIATTFSPLPNRQISFLERDTRISLPVVSPATVSSTNLGFVAWLPPIGIVILGAAFAWAVAARSKATVASQELRAAITWGAFALLALGQALAVTSSVTHILKASVGEIRPNGLALMNYCGLADAHATGNWTSFSECTSLLGVGDMSKALTTSAKDLADARRAFPSGHASQSFAGVMVAFLLLRQVLRVQEWMSIGSVLTSTLLVLPGYVAISRVWDNEHHVWDVFAGTLLGIFCAWMSVRWMVAAKRADWMLNSPRIRPFGTADAHDKPLTSTATATDPVSGVQASFSMGSPASSGPGPSSASASVPTPI